MWNVLVPNNITTLCALGPNGQSLGPSVDRAIWTYTSGQIGPSEWSGGPVLTASVVRLSVAHQLHRKTVIESTESTESLSHTSSRPTFALAGRAAGGGRLDDEKRPPVAARCAPRRGDQPAQGHERKADRMTSGCPPSCRPMLFALRSLRSFVAASGSANLRQSADLPSLLPRPSSPSFVDFVASCETSPPRQDYPERPRKRGGYQS
jgi:hypothetical protein